MRIILYAAEDYCLGCHSRREFIKNLIIALPLQRVQECQSIFKYFLSVSSLLFYKILIIINNGDDKRLKFAVY